MALNRQQQKAMILHPTVRFEQDGQQAIKVDEEKRTIYSPCCIPHFSERYNIPVAVWEVKGLLFGARGTSFKFTSSLLRNLKFTNDDIRKMSILILRDSLSILHSHLYCNV